ncbi:MAG: hypothetical protein Q7U58_04105, partial [Hydrogenophaga sp.]|nr:hypothetical protein [Hydrogenophaga sp.]
RPIMSMGFVVLFSVVVGHRVAHVNWPPRATAVQDACQALCAEKGESNQGLCGFIGALLVVADSVWRGIFGRKLPVLTAAPHVCWAGSQRILKAAAPWRIRCAGRALYAGDVCEC